MCGIFGYIGKGHAIQKAVKGLKKLEYRGYDSAGVAGLRPSTIVFCKKPGKISVIEPEITKIKGDFDVAIAHTRWATHGRPTENNAHPHFDADEKLALVHNGIVENFEALRKFLEERGVHCTTETDTEVVAKLLGYHYKGDILEAVRLTIPLLQGSYAFSLIHKDFPEQIIVFAHNAPMTVGIGKGEAFVSSDPKAFAEHTNEVLFLRNGEIGVIKAREQEFFDLDLGRIEKNSEIMDLKEVLISKGEFPHYTLKEIYDQPDSIRSALLGRFIEEFGTATFEELTSDIGNLLSVERIVLIACGTSWHAGLIAGDMLEDLARIPTQVHISSEYRYKNPVVPRGTLVIAISQSGETADTLAAVQELKAKGARVLAVCNVYGSAITRESDYTIYLKAGPEIGVASTKAFTSQVVVLTLFALMMARMRHMDKAEGVAFIKAMEKLPHQVEEVLKKASQIESLAKKYAHFQNCFYLGRRYMFPTSLEGALKLKEISYINANAYPAGEMKHGPIALISPECLTVALVANKTTYQKMLSNLLEVKARNGPIIACAEEGQKGLEKIADDVVFVPSTIDELAPILITIITQLFAYYVAKERGEDIDQPRNLAKSVTVE